MHEEFIWILAKKLRSEGRAYHETGDILGLGNFRQGNYVHMKGCPLRNVDQN